MRRAVAAVTAMAICAGAMAGCGRSAEPADTAAGAPTVTSTYLNEVTSTDQPRLGGQLVYALPGDSNSWNPALAQWGSYSMVVARSMFDFLTGFDEHGEIKTDLATSIVPNADFTAWTITLPDGITFTNGKPLDADALVRNQKYIKASPVIGETFDYIDSWDIKDRLTVVVHMNQPWASFPEGLVSQVGAIADPDWLVLNDGINAVGTGPFQIENWDIGEKLELVKNPNYWRKDQWGNRFPYIDRLTFDIITDDSKRAGALRNGDVDVSLQSFATSDITDLRASGERGELQVFSDTKLETSEDHVILNSAKPPFDDLDARLALAYATDQADYLSVITGGLNQPADSAYAPNSPWYSPIDYPKYDPVKAKQLVEKVKAKHGGEFTFELLAQKTPEAMKVQNYLQEQWAKVGIVAKPSNVEQQAKIINSVTGNYQATVMQLFDSPSPDNDCIFWRSSGKPVGTMSLNFSRLNDPVLRDKCRELAGLPDLASRKPLVTAIQQRLAEQVPYIWLAHVSRSVVANDKVVNLVHRTLPDGSTALDFTQGSHTLYQVWLKA